MVTDGGLLSPGKQTFRAVVPDADTKLAGRRK
jgi:hypothetical protein